MRRTHLLAAAAVTGVALSAVAGPALAQWATSGTGTGSATATSLVAPTQVATVPGSPAHTAITINYTPQSNPPGTTYTVTRDKKKNGDAGAELVCASTSGSCADTGLKPSTQYAYTVAASLEAWKALAPVVSLKTADEPAATATTYNLTLTPSATRAGSSANWNAKMTFTVTDNLGDELDGFKITGAWTAPSTTSVTCTTGMAGPGSCELATGNFSSATTTTFNVATVTAPTSSALTAGTLEMSDTANRP